MRAIKQIIDFTGGYNLFVDPTKIGDNEFQEFENVDIFSKGKYFNACLRKGYKVYNTNEPNKGTKILNVCEYITHSKKTNKKYLIIKTNNSIERTPNNNYTGQFTTILDEDTSTEKVRMMTFKDILYIINRNDGTNYYSNLKYDGTNYAEQGLIPCPQLFGLYADTDSESKIEEGTYAYLITFIYDNGQESFVIPTVKSNETETGVFDEQTYMYGTDFVFHFRYATVKGSKNIKIYNIPTGNSNVVARRIYRTRGRPGRFYFLTQINDNTTTTYIDRKSNDFLIEEYKGELLYKPPIAKYLCQHKDRLWFANIKENQFDKTINVDDIIYNVEENTNGITTPTVRLNNRIIEYKYKFAYLYLDFIKDTSASYQHELNTNGFIGKKSAEKEVVVDNINNDTKYKITLSNIKQENDYSKQIVVFRNNCLLINKITINREIGTIEFENTGGVLTELDIVKIFKVGQKINITGCEGSNAIPDGDYYVVDVDLTNKRVKVDLLVEGHDHTEHTGKVKTYEYYYIGTTATNGTEFEDAHEDAEIVKNKGNYIAGNIEELNGDRTYKSLVIYSEINKGDTFLPLNQFPIDPDDNDEITGIFSEEEGITIFKERGIYKLYTYSHNNTYWQLRKVVHGIGATEPDSVVQLPTGQYIFMSNKIFYIWQMGMYPERISDKIQTMLDKTTITTIESLYDPITNRVIFVYSTPYITGNVLIFDLNIKGWYHYKGLVKDLGLNSPYLIKSGKILFGSKYNRIYCESDGYLDEYLEERDTQGIKLKIKTKEFDTYNLDIKRIGLKLYCDKEGAQIKITPYKDGVATTSLNKTCVAGENRISHDINIQYAKRFSVLIESETTSAQNIGIAIRELMFEYEERHQVGGWK